MLKGKNGIACKNAELGICISWTNKKLTQTGIIIPILEMNTSGGITCMFRHSFEPNSVSGDLELSILLYIKTKAEKVFADELDLINETGIFVGNIETIVIDFNELYMEFPIEECKSDKEPLWWVEFSAWEDPKTIDMFTKDSICLYLNSYYADCPVPSTIGTGTSIKNFDLLVDILSQTYFLIIKNLSEDDLKATIQNIGINDNSICGVIHKFIEDCSEELHWESSEKLLKSIQINMRAKLMEGMQE